MYDTIKLSHYAFYGYYGYYRKYETKVDAIPN